MQVVIFLSIAFLFSWAIALWMSIQGGFLELGAGFATLYLALYMAGPSIAAGVVTRIYERENRLTLLGFSLKNFQKTFAMVLLGWSLPIVLAILSNILSNVLGGVDLIAPHLQGADYRHLFLALFVAIPANTVWMILTEELGWRGWLQPQLMHQLMHLGFWPMCLITGAIWGLWHAPIIAMGYNYPDLGLWGPILMIVFCVLLTPYLAVMRELGGIYAPSALHGSLNAVGGLSLLFLGPHTGWVWNGIMGVGGFIVMVMGWALIARKCSKSGGKRMNF